MHLPPRDDVIEFDKDKDLDELMQNLHLEGCPEEYHDAVKNAIMTCWDMRR